MKLGSPRAFHLTLFLFLGAAFFSFGSYHNVRYKFESDGKYYYQFLISGWFDHDLDFANNYSVPQPPFMALPIDHYEFGKRINPVTHRPTNVFACGLAVLWLPAFCVARLTVAISHAFGADALDPNPWSRFHQYLVAFSAVIYTTLGLAMLGDIWRRWTDAACSRTALLLTLLATPLFYYTVFEASMSHAYDFFSLALILWLLVRGREQPTWRNFVGLGLACALHVLVRTQNMLTVAIVAAVVIPYWDVFAKKSFGRYAMFVVIVGVGSLPCFLINRYLFGQFWVVPQTISFHVPFLDPRHPKVIDLLFSNRNGLFSQHPVLLLGLAGYVWRCWDAVKQRSPHRWLLLGLLVAFAGQVYVNSIVLDWWAGASFGQRRLVVMLPLFAFGFATLIEKVRASGQCSWWITEKAVAVFAIVSGLYLTGIHVFLWDENQPHNIWSWMFVEAPKAMLAHRGGA